MGNLKHSPTGDRYPFDDVGDTNQDAMYTRKAPYCDNFVQFSMK